MSRGTVFPPSELDAKLKLLDIDEGIRIESTSGHGIEKMFINRRMSGTFVLQHGNEFIYTIDPAEVRQIIRKTFPRGKVTFWQY